MAHYRTLLAALLIGVSSPALAQEAPPDAVAAQKINDPDHVPERIQKVVADLHPVQEQVTLANGLFTLNLPKDFGYLTPDDADIYLHKVVGFQAEVKTLGAIVSLAHPLGSPASWYTLITFNGDGHISDDEARTLNPDTLLATIKQENDARNAKLIARGLRYLTINLAGWAETPTYDPAMHSLYWALEIQTAQARQSTIIYSLRFLGRQSGLSYTIETHMEQLPMLENDIPRLIKATHFNAPNRYEDFNATTDRTASYGLGDLVLGHTGGLHGNAESAVTIAASLFIRAIGILMLVGATLFWVRKKRNTPPKSPPAA